MTQPKRISAVDHNAAWETIAQAQRGDCIIYNVGSTPGPLGAIMWKMSEAGYFNLVQRTDRKCGGNQMVQRAFVYMAQRTRTAATRNDLSKIFNRVGIQ